MASGKLTPRQKMINMMYLVLTALLALNVSTEVLNAFRLVNEGLTTSNIALDTKNTGIYQAFEKQMGQDANKAKEFYDKAQLAKKYAADIYTLLQVYKDTIIAKAGGREKDSTDRNYGEIEMRDNIDIATAWFVEERSKTDKGAQRGEDLQKQILETRTKLLALIDATEQESFKSKIPLDAPTPKGGNGKGVNSWQFKTFNHVPVTAAVTILTKFQNDVISSEGAVIEYLIKKIGETDFKFTDLTSKIIAPSSYIMQGQQYKSDIFLAAFNSTQNPEIYLGPTGSFKKNANGEFEKIDSPNPLPAGYSEGMKMPDAKISGGMGRYEVSGSGVGERTYGGIIRVKNPAGGYTFYPFESKYQVAPKAVVVSPTKMNVLYIGVENPMEISVPGVGQGDVSATLVGSGSLAKDPSFPSQYIANVTSVGKCKIAVSAKLEGKVQPMGEKEFRIKRIPDPVPMTSGKLRGGNVQPGTLQAQSGILALLENFDFDARFNVVSFQMVYSSKGEIFKKETQGPAFSPDMKQFMGRAKPKDIIFIDEIKVVGPDKQPRKLGQIAFTVI